MRHGAESPKFNEISGLYSSQINECAIILSLEQEWSCSASLDELSHKTFPPHRFQTDFASASDWLVGANEHLKTWSDLANTSDLNQECVHSSLIKLLVRLSSLHGTFLYQKTLNDCSK